MERSLNYALMLVAAYAVFATSFMFLKQLYSTTVVTAVLSAIVAIVLLGAATFVRSSLANWCAQFGERLSVIDGRRWLLACFIGGSALRCLTLLHCVPTQTSDFASYFGLAQSLAIKGVYATAGSRAYWPPGLPFEMAGLVWLFGTSWVVPVINNILLFGAVLIISHKLARHVVGIAAAHVTALAITLWPNLIFAIGLADKQQLVMAMMSAALYLYLRAHESKGVKSMRLAIAAGMCLGGATLTQPSHILFPGALILLELYRGSTLRRSAAIIAPLVLGIVLVVSPWTMRNYMVLGQIIPVANTAGISLYVGNNPNATGTYVPVPELGELDEIAANKKAAQLATEWIISNPTKFASLIVPKNIAFLGDDSDGPFWSLKRGCNRSGLDYILAKTLTNVLWLTLMLLVFMTTLLSRQGRWPSQGLGQNLLTLWFLYFFALHSVFESGGRHHIAPAIGLIVIASQMFSRRVAEATSARV